MRDRFNGHDGRRRLIETLLANRLVCHDEPLATAIADSVVVEQVAAGEHLISEGASDNDLFFILSGKLAIIVRGTFKSERLAGSHVGEMSAINPARPRSASVVATEGCVVARLSEAAFSTLTMRFPVIWRRLAEELAERVADSNRLVPTSRTDTNLFVISSTEALPIARAVEGRFANDPFTTVVWDKGVFVASTYPIEALEAALHSSDFALAIAAPDDQTTSRGRRTRSPRDNVTFEVGFFMGRLGRQRTFILRPTGFELKLPNDLAGLTLLSFSTDTSMPLHQRVAPACDAIRQLIAKLGLRGLQWL